MDDHSAGNKHLVCLADLPKRALDSSKIRPDDFLWFFIGAWAIRISHEVFRLFTLRSALLFASEFALFRVKWVAAQRRNTLSKKRCIPLRCP
jgi:hypothetical protein